MELIIFLDESEFAAVEFDISKPAVAASECNDDTDAIFYDWLEDEKGVICGLELHETATVRSFFNRETERRECVQFDVFPRVMLIPATGELKGLGVEGFGDISIIGKRGNVSAIKIGLDNWLPADRKEDLLRSLKKRNEAKERFQEP